MLPVTVTTSSEALLCPIRTVLSKVTGKWQMLVLLSLEDGSLRFGQLKRTIGDITQRVLTENLRGLERDGYLIRTVVDGPPIAVFYELTPLGLALVKILKTLVLWADESLERVKISRQAYEERS